MGRVTGSLSYRVKNTYVEIGAHQEAGPEDLKGGQFDAWKAGRGYVPDTPSPFLHPSASPQDSNIPSYNLSADGAAFGPDGLPLAFGDMSEGGFGMGMMPGGFDAQGNSGFYGLPAMMYDPATGEYSTCGWCMPIEALGQGGPGGEGEGCGPGMDAIEGFEGVEGQDFERPADGQGWAEPMGENGWNGEGMEQMDAMQEGWSQDGSMQMDGMGEYSEGQGWNGDGMAMEHMDVIQENSGWGRDGGYGEGCVGDDSQGWNGDMEGGRSGRGEQGWSEDGRWGRGKGGRAGRRQERQQLAQQERSEASGSQGNSEVSPQSGVDASGAEGAVSPVGFTTVMLRNIPNKYTREMLVKQLSVDFRGRFDFVYLPIDFKNRCNVGYGFINFRTTEDCEDFVNRFNGVDVRKCLPGLNSRKVAEVTPARVQGLEENVRRLRNGPVMNELVHHPEWMPLLLDEEGEEKPFPLPDQPCAPVKPRRRAGGREDHGGGGRGGW